MHVASTTLFEGPAPDYDELRDHIESRLHLVPRFRQKLRFVPFGQGRPVWVDDPQFNLDYHIRHTALPPPGSEEQLRTLAARIFSQRLDRSKPLWEMWLVDGVEGDRFALVTKTHHCLVDGVSGVDITTVLFDLDREPEPAPEPDALDPAARAERRPAARRGAARARDQPGRDRARRARRCCAPRGGSRGAAVEAPRGRRRVRPDRLRAPRASPFNVQIGPYRRFAWVRTDLAGAQADQERRRRHGQRRRPRGRRRRARALPARRAATRPSELELRAMVPISVRAADEHGALGNRVSSMMAPLPVWCEDPVERLRAGHVDDGRPQALASRRSARRC